MGFWQALQQRNCKVAGPTSNGFDLEAWLAFWHKTHDGDPKDAPIFQLGQLIGWQRSRIAGTLGHIGTLLRLRPWAEMARRIVHDINRTDLDAMGRYEGALAGMSAVAIDQLAAERCFTDAQGQAHTPRGAMEATIDAAAVTLAFVRQQGHGFGTRDASRQDEVPFESALHHVMQMAHHWVANKRSWDAALWFGCDVAIDPRVGAYAVDETRSALARQACLDLARRDAKRTWPDEDEASPGTAASPKDRRAVIPIVFIDAGQACRLRIGPVASLPGEVGDFIAAYLDRGAHLQEVTLGTFLAETHPELGLSMRQMMGVWVALSCIALQLREQARRDGASGALVASVLPRRELLVAITATAQLPPDAVDKCLHFMTFGHRKQSTIWDAPLIAVSADELGLPWMPLYGANHARLLGAWCKSDKTLAQRFDQKGTFNEKLLFDVLRHLLETGPLKGRASLHGPSLKLPRVSNDEIDILLLIDGRTLLVIETASVPHPAEPYEYWEMAARLTEKGMQCIRQCQCLAEPDEATARWMREDLGLPVDGLDIVGVVATNSFMWEGRQRPADPFSPCFVHIDTLVALLDAGGSQFGSIGPDGEAITFHTRCLDGAGLSLGDAVVRSLRDPPKARVYERGLAMQAFHLPPLDGTDVEGVHRGWVFHPPRVEDMAGLMAGLGCAVTSDRSDPGSSPSSRP